MFVHFPIAFYFLELFLIGLWIIKKDQAYQRFSYLSFKLGYALMLAAMTAGLVDVGGIGNIRGMVQRHVVAALTVFIIYSLRGIFYWKTNHAQNDYRVWKLVGAVVGSVAVGYAGYLGGLLVFS
jgi:uncharacterized membrane protein